MFLLISADFEKSLQVSLSSVERWTGLQKKKKCLELGITFINVMLSPPEAHYSETRKKILPSNDFDKVSCIIFIFWGTNLYFTPNKYLKSAIHIWRCVYPRTHIYLPFFNYFGNRTWAETPFPLWQVTGCILKHILTSQSSSRWPCWYCFQSAWPLPIAALWQHYPSPPPHSLDRDLPRLSWWAFLVCRDCHRNIRDTVVCKKKSMKYQGLNQSLFLGTQTTCICNWD